MLRNQLLEMEHNFILQFPTTGTNLFRSTINLMTIPTTYNAYTYDAYGPVNNVVKLTEVKTQQLPVHSVRLKVHSAALNLIDCKLVEALGLMMTGGTPTKPKPYGFGFDVAGTIVEVGVGVHARHLKVGDEVYAMTQFTGCGTVAEYVDIDHQLVALKPKNIDFDVAASVPLVALTSWQAFYEYTQLKNRADQRVLIIGGSSATGMYGIQFAKLTGAHVTVTASVKNEVLLKSLGADVVIDYRTQKWVDVIEPHTIDIIYDCGFEPNAWNEGAQKVLKKDIGELVTLHGCQNPIPSAFGAKNHDRMVAFPTGLHLQHITQLFEEGKLKAIVDSVVPFEKALEGITRVKSLRAVGKVVVKVL